jgi:4-hydroxybenzoate polyprenyltransferase
MLPVLWGALMAGVLNAANNAINQIYDLDIDRVNKPSRPLPSGTLSMGEAWGFTILTTLVAWVLAWLATPVGLEAHRECFWIVLFTSFMCWAYSAPPLQTKRKGFWANITIAIPRGMLLKVAGWSTVKTIFDPSPGSSARSSGCSCSARRPPRISPTSRATARAAARRCRSSTA